MTSVSKDRLSKLPVSNVLQAMQGATSGVTIQQSSSIPGDAPSTIVRGQNSINANSGPYVVVDGIPLNNTGGSLADIDPNDIESIEILKDASATAIYGTNGANGVILVTTKRGKEGRAKVTYSGYVGIEDFAKKLQFCDGDQIIQRYKDYVAQNPGETMFNESVKYQNEVDNYNAGRQTDWLYDVASRTGVIQDHNVTVSGGSENTKYFVSLDYYDQKGILKGYDYKRYSIRTNLDVDVTKWLQFGTNIFIASHNRDGGRVNLLNAEAMSPWGKVYEDDGILCIYPMYSEQLWSNPLLGTKHDDERRRHAQEIQREHSPCHEVCQRQPFLQQPRRGRDPLGSLIRRPAHHIVADGTYQLLLRQPLPLHLHGAPRRQLGVRRQQQIRYIPLGGRGLEHLQREIHGALQLLAQQP